MKIVATSVQLTNILNEVVDERATLNYMLQNQQSFSLDDVTWSLYKEKVKVLDNVIVSIESLYTCLDKIDEIQQKIKKS